jgi:hypothetical protein
VILYAVRGLKVIRGNFLINLLIFLSAAQFYPITPAVGLFFFPVVELELRAYSLSHSTSPIL